ncbi:pyridoxamine 5'-phosphate oxidase family protein [Polymorphobacter sp.]|uniref:pyridoxamine 5'-phosphate oxidase family protein n=1 Tax=Polymorphobacter sp. TaxID=1909290 RepID=UPI003F722E86
MDAALADILTGAWATLTRGAADRRSPVHTPVIASIGTSTGSDATPDARVMVLRHVDPAAATLRFHTDARSPKCRDLDGRPVAVLAYHPGQAVQLRLHGRARIVTQGPEADAAWAASTPFARRCYLAEHPPGTPLPAPGSGLPADVEGLKPSEARLLQARPHFALLLVTIHHIDWLHLAQTGHRRARFEAADGWRGRWLVP